MDIRLFLKDLTRRGRIIKYEDQRLRIASRPIEHIDKSVIRLAKRLKEEIHRINRKAKEGDELAAGLAAPQLGENIQLFVIETDSFQLTMVNPQITAGPRSAKLLETCLSLPGRFFRVERPKTIRVIGLDLEGKRVVRRLHGRVAQMVSHEVDHLRGFLLDQVALEELTSPPLSALDK